MRGNREKERGEKSDFAFAIEKERKEGRRREIRRRRHIIIIVASSHDTTPFARPSLHHTHAKHIHTHPNTNRTHPPPTTTYY
jgi:hypothetical protein